MASLFSFPHPVNDVSARLVAGGVVIMTVLAIALDQPWLIAVIAYGFLARVLTGPKLSPLGLLVTKVLTPTFTKWFKLPFIPQPGPAKRFAQGIGAVLSISAAVLAVGFGQTVIAYVLIGLITAAASLEAFFGFCLGCKIFAGLMRIGIVPPDTCEDCNNIWNRVKLPETTAS